MAIPRRYLQYSLRSLFVLTALVAIVAMWYGGRLAQAKRQKAAVAELRAAGCDVVYEYQEQGLAEPDAPQWQRDLLGDDFFANVARVDMSQRPTYFCGAYYAYQSRPQPPRATPRTVAILADLRNCGTVILNNNHLQSLKPQQLLNCRGLTGLELIGTAATDEDLEYVVQCQKLERLNLTNNHITQDGLLKLRRLPCLRSLIIAGSAVGSPNMEPISALVHLEELDLCMCRHVTDESIVEICNLRGLKDLNLCRTTVTGVGFNGTSIRGLKRLNLSETPFTDSGMACLDGLEELETLSLSNTRITDAGMNHLGRLRSLKELSLSDVIVTDQGISCIASLKRLERLDIGGDRVKITDRGMSQLTGLTKLKELQSPHGISNEGLRHLAGLTEMEDLFMPDSTVDDNGLAYLKNMNKLQRLWINTGHFSEGALANLVKDHPGLKIESLPEPSEPTDATDGGAFDPFAAPKPEQ